jgi:small subunit ribosomal protein S16
MVKIRLRRTGAKKQPHYRVVVADSKSPRDGKFIEVIGNYNPRTEPPTVEIDAERALYWLSVGAQPSEAVRQMLDKMGIMAQVPVVRKGESSIDEIMAQLEVAKADKKAPQRKAKSAKAVVEQAPPAVEAELLGAEDEEEAWDEFDTDETDDLEDVLEDVEDDTEFDEDEDSDDL